MRVIADVEVDSASTDGVPAAVGGITSGWLLRGGDSKATFYDTIFDGKETLKKLS